MPAGDPERERGDRHLDVVRDDATRHHRAQHLRIGDVAVAGLARASRRLRRDRACAVGMNTAATRRFAHDGRIPR